MGNIFYRDSIDYVGLALSPDGELTLGGTASSTLSGLTNFLFRFDGDGARDMHFRGGAVDGLSLADPRSNASPWARSYKVMAA